jgi:hypothetical protein
MPALHPWPLFSACAATDHKERATAVSRQHISLFIVAFMCLSIDCVSGESNWYVVASNLPGLLIRVQLIWLCGSPMALIANNPESSVWQRQFTGMSDHTMLAHATFSAVQ